MSESVILADLARLAARAEQLGATASRVAEVAKIRTGAWTRMKCQFGCPNYGATLCCPPYTPDFEQTQKFLAEYKYGLIVEYTVNIEGVKPEDFGKVDAQVGKGLLELLLTLERDAFLMNHYRAFALKAGRCRLCDKCNLHKCVHPTQARPSLEACGIDVFALAQDNGFDMKVITGPVKELKIYGMLLVE